MSGVGQAVWEAYEGVGEAVWIAYQGVGDAVWFAHQGVGSPVWIAYQGVGRAVWSAYCFPSSELVHTGTDTRVPIGSLKVGDKISSWDMERNRFQYTAVTDIHKSKVWELMCFNNSLRVSSSHPLMVIDSSNIGEPIPKWKAALDVSIGDCMVGADGNLVMVKSRSYHPYPRSKSVEVLNLSTDSGSPFIVGNFVVRAKNAEDNLEWADTPITQKILLAS